MPAYFLCDTNVISELMLPRPQVVVRQWMEAREEIFISVLTLEALHFGLHRKDLAKKLAWLDRFVTARCKVLPVDARIARRAGEMRGHFAKIGQTRTQTDLLIAATALASESILATRNTRDFEGTNTPLFNPFAGSDLLPEEHAGLNLTNFQAPDMDWRHESIEDFALPRRFLRNYQQFNRIHRGDSSRSL